jgi:hypothetical protein
MVVRHSAGNFLVWGEGACVRARCNCNGYNFILPRSSAQLWEGHTLLFVSFFEDFSSDWPCLLRIKFNNHLVSNYLPQQNTNLFLFIPLMDYLWLANPVQQPTSKRTWLIVTNLYSCHLCQHLSDKCKWCTLIRSRFQIKSYPHWSYFVVEELYGTKKWLFIILWKITPRIIDGKEGALALT